jgi:hypothetical protein
VLRDEGNASEPQEVAVAFARSWCFRGNTNANWVEAVRTLLEHGASTNEITLDPDDPKPPSPEVADQLRAHLDRLPPR